MATYSTTSPWYSTPIKQNYLDILKIRPVANTNGKNRKCVRLILKFFIGKLI